MISDTLAAATAFEGRVFSLELDVIRAARALAALSEDDIRDYEQGLCYFCEQGWVEVSGKMRHVDAHAGDCKFMKLRRAVFALDDFE